MVDTDQRTDGVSFDRYEYDDEILVVADLGPGVEASVDLLDDAALVVVETPGGESAQREIDIPQGAAQAFINNGVLSIEVER